MQITSPRNLVYLSLSQTLPAYLQTLQSVHWHFCQSSEDLKNYLQSQQGEVFVIIRVENVGERLMEAFLKLGKKNLKLSFIFIAQNIEKSAQRMVFSSPNVLFLFASEGARITEAVTRRIQGLPVKSRRQERIAVQSPVMLKKSILAEESPTGKGVQFIREGCMQDFSKGGAQIALSQGQVGLKDFVSLMYQNRYGQWVSVESQVRWVVSTGAGQQIIGVQFLAVSA